MAVVSPCEAPRHVLGGDKAPELRDGVAVVGAQE